LILGLTKRLVLTAATVAEATVYFGQWDFGVAVTGLRDAVSWLLMHRIGWERTPFSDEDYRETVRVTYERLVKEEYFAESSRAPDDVLQRYSLVIWLSSPVTSAYSVEHLRLARPIREVVHRGDEIGLQYVTVALAVTLE
jgi:hypothetical protein